jgi:hypothetical protein
MRKPPLRDGDGLWQQVGVAVDPALLAVLAGFCPAGDVIGKTTPEKPRRHKVLRTSLPGREMLCKCKKMSFQNFTGTI